MTEQEYVSRTIAELKAAFAHRSVSGSVEAFAYDLGDDMIAAIMSEGFPPSTRQLFQKLDGSHRRSFDLGRLTRRELIAIRKCLHLLSHRQEIGDDPVRGAIRNVIKVKPATVH